MKEATVRDHRIVISLSAADFEQSMGRKPRDEDDFEKWALLMKKVLLNGHVGWDILYECTRDAIGSSSGGGGLYG